MKTIALVGATGLVGQKMIQVLEERGFGSFELIPAASSKSIGKLIHFGGKEYSVCSIEEAISRKPDFAIFSAGGSVSLQYAPLFAIQGTVVIDNSSAWRMDPKIPLIVPQINGKQIKKTDLIIANPNCSTIQLVMALAPLHQKYRIKRVVVSTYQSVTGTGTAGIAQLDGERAGKPVAKVYPHPIDLNLIPHGGDFDQEGYTSEEMKLVNETRKILNDTTIQLTATVVRVPVKGGHSEAVNVEFYNDYTIAEIHSLLSQISGITILDDPDNSLYPMPLYAEGKDDVFVGRIRRDHSQPNSLNMWIVADNLRKGAATNAVEILEFILQNKIR